MRLSAIVQVMDKGCALVCVGAAMSFDEDSTGVDDRGSRLSLVYPSMPGTLRSDWTQLRAKGVPMGKTAKTKVCNLLGGQTGFYSRHCEFRFVEG